MPNELKPGERVSHGVRRVIRKRIDTALKELAAANGGVTDEAVHEARTEFKQIRAVLRLVRGELGKKRFDKENRTFRDAGRPLSKVRDAKVLVDTFDGLVNEDPPPFSRMESKLLRQALIERTVPTPQALHSRGREISDISRDIRKSRRRVKHWPVRRNGWGAVGKGLEASYAQGRKALKEVRATFGVTELHEWRKRTKDLRYELELIQVMAPEAIRPLIERAHRLTDLLGDDHDLAVLRSAIEQEPSGSELLDRIDRSRNALQLEAIALGEVLFKLTPVRFGRRMKRLWQDRPRC